MVRRLLWAALAAVLAVALPAAADGIPLDDSVAVPAACPPDVPLCAPVSSALATESSGGSESGDGSCEVWEINVPGNGADITETLVVDPDGCIRGVIRKVLGWPPILDGRIAIRTTSSAGPTDPDFLVP